MDISPSKDGNLIKQVLKEGTPNTSPSWNDRVKVHLILSHDGKTFDDKEISFDVGFGKEFGILLGVDITVSTMNLDEYCTAQMGSDFAYGSEGHEDANITPNTVVIAHIHLIEITKVKEFWDLNEDQKMAFATKMKYRGNVLYSTGSSKAAYRCYRSVCKTLEGSVSVRERRSQEAVALLTAGRLNAALCLHKEELYPQCVQLCDKVLRSDPDNTKALYRKGKALFALSEFVQAVSAFLSYQTLEPSSTLVATDLALCREALQKEREKEEVLYHDIFEKMASESSKNFECDSPIQPVDNWSNDLAEEMISLHEEMEAFGETMPEPKTKVKPGHHHNNRLHPIKDELEEVDL